MTETPESSLAMLRKITAQHYGPDLADLVREALLHGISNNWRWARDANALIRKIDEGRVPE